MQYHDSIILAGLTHALKGVRLRPLVVKPIKKSMTGNTIVGEAYYLKSEADKAIAEMEESHKKEVEQLLMEIAELKESQRWRKCSEELPEEDKYVIAFCPQLDVVERARLHDDGEWRDFNWDCLQVSHWMPCPKPPEV